MRSILSLLASLFLFAPPIHAQNKLTISHEINKSSQLIVSGLDEKTLLSGAKLDAKQWADVAAVVVATGTDEEISRRPHVLGKWKVEGTKLVFEPKFPLGEGVKYRILLNPKRILDPQIETDFAAIGEITIPRKVRVPSTIVTQVYPTRNILPENQLKFYVQFSAPMSRGEVYQRVKLLNDQGKPVDLPFLQIEEELWDFSGQRITLLFDPGRVKRGLKPREELGPILEEGKRYTLVISQDWKDGDGTPLKEGFRKTFKVVAPDMEPPDPKTWKTNAPSAGKISPLELRFPEPMDHALLNRVLWVVDGDGKKIGGTISVHEEETLWKFTPEKAWTVGEYKIIVEKILEDLAANRIGRPFEVDTSKSQPADPKESKTIELPFRVK